MSNKLFHFFYSEKEECFLKKQGKTFTNTCVINGKIKKYTEMNDNRFPAVKLDDKKYLGKGKVYSVNGIIQK